MGKWGQNYRRLVKRRFPKHFCTIVVLYCICHAKVQRTYYYVSCYMYYNARGLVGDDITGHWGITVRHKIVNLSDRC